MAKSASQVAANWSQRLQQSTQQITDGVNGVTSPPGQAAARQKGAWVANTQQAADKWAARTAAVPLQQWQQDMIQKGIPRIAQGAAAAQPKMEAFMGKLLPYVASQRAQLPPRGNLQTNIQRMVAWTNAMAKFSSGS